MKFNVYKVNSGYSFVSENCETEVLSQMSARERKRKRMTCYVCITEDDVKKGNFHALQEAAEAAKVSEVCLGDPQIHFMDYDRLKNDIMFFARALDCVVKTYRRIDEKEFWECKYSPHGWFVAGRKSYTG